ncbi:MAG: DUF3380 domain-containing protein [Anaerolineae bacterium]|nr:DUF3380 domain-containing protein [Anaerolineae bacterium]
MPEYGIVNTDLLNLRAGASTSTPVITQLKRGTILEILATVNADWVNVRVDGATQSGFVSKAYLTISPTKPGEPTPVTPTPPTPVAPTPTPSGQQAQVITASGINVRSGPGVQFAAITALPNGTIVDVTGREGDWLKIRTGSIEGYALAQFMQLITATPHPTRGYLIENPDLLNLDLVPDRIIPSQASRSSEAVIAKTWNSFGGLIGKLSSLLNIPMGSVVAVLAAESGGNAFSADGRMVIRFEVHIFYENWGKRNEEVFNRFFQFDRSSPRNAWKGHTWRPNTDAAFQQFHGNQDLEWQVLAFARALDDTAALLSISMGAPQIMGFNFKRLGYESVQRMFEYFARSAHAQILAMFDFVKSPSGVSPAIQALQTNDFLTFASIYNGTANAQTYKQIIENYAGMFDRLIKTAQPTTPPPPTFPRGPIDPPPSDPAPVTPPAPSPTPASPTPVAPVVPPPVVVIGPTPPPAVTDPVVASSVDGLNVRSAPNTQASILTTLAKNQQVSALETADQVRAKTARPSSDMQWINIRLDDGRVGYVAAWLVTPSSGIAKADIDAYINNIPDRFEIPAEYDTFWSAHDRIGLPDPFNELPIQITTQARLVNLSINGFGPNTFALQNWQNYYNNTGGMHNGYDYIVETGTPVRAVADGVIVRNWPFMGNVADKTVILWCYLPAQFKDSSNNRQMSNVLVCYAHLSNNDLKKEGDVVKAGDVIGISGTPAGETSNDHLHMELHMLATDTPLRKSTRRLLKLYNGDQPNDNFTPFNPLLFFSKRMIKYHLQQGFARGFGGQPAYPTAEMLGQAGASHLGLLDQLTLAYYQYGVPVVWKNAGKPWPTGVITLRMVPDRLASFPTWTPYSLAQKG